MTKKNHIVQKCILTAIILLLCSNCSYDRGSTHYMKGTAFISQPSLIGKGLPPNRTFEGIRLAGKDTDIIPLFWDNKLQKRGQIGTFEDFEARYQDLLVYGTKGAEPALNSFISWCKRRRISWDFEKFWKTRV